MTTGLARSVQTRLVRHAHALGIDPNLVLARYAAERFLYRLSRSAHGERFVLKGALMMLVWLGETIRPTRDADLLGFGDLDADSLHGMCAEICALPVEPDGLTFEVASIRVDAIRAENATADTARAELVRAERAVTALLESSPELAQVVGDCPRRFVLLDDYSKGAIELARYETGEFRWLGDGPRGT